MARWGSYATPNQRIFVDEGCQIVRSKFLLLCYSCFSGSQEEGMRLYVYTFSFSSAPNANMLCIYKKYLWQKNYAVHAIAS